MLLRFRSGAVQSTWRLAPPQGNELADFERSQIQNREIAASYLGVDETSTSGLGAHNRGDRPSDEALEALAPIVPHRPVCTTWASSSRSSELAGSTRTGLGAGSTCHLDFPAILILAKSSIENRQPGHRQFSCELNSGVFHGLFHVCLLSGFYAQDRAGSTHAHTLSRRSRILRTSRQEEIRRRFCRMMVFGGGGGGDGFFYLHAISTNPIIHPIPM